MTNQPIADMDAVLAQVLNATAEEITPDDVGKPAPWQQHNSLMNMIANSQGLEPGSWEWLQGGPAAWSGQSGEHSSYGWRHHYKISPAYVRSVIANYGHRRTYYTNAPNRGFGYEAGGRPKNWAPEIPGDKPNGTCDYLTKAGVVTVSGPEVEHFWLDPLWAVVDTPSSPPVMTPWGPRSSRSLAGIMATMQVRSIMGQIRDQTTGKPYPWCYGDRANSRILDTWLQGMKRNAVDPLDQTTGLQFIDILLAHYEASPGIDPFGNAPSPNLFPVGTYNGLYWLLPVFHDATQILTNPASKARFQAIVDRWSQWALDLELTVPGRGFDMSRFYVDRAAFVTSKPLNTIKPLLNPNNIVFDLGWEVWSHRACSVAAKVTGSAVLKAAEQKLLAKHGGDLSKKQWIVNSDREYAVYTPIE